MPKPRFSSLKRQNLLSENCEFDKELRKITGIFTSRGEKLPSYLLSEIPLHLQLSGVESS